MVHPSLVRCIGVQSIESTKEHYLTKNSFEAFLAFLATSDCSRPCSFRINRNKSLRIAFWLKFSFFCIPSNNYKPLFRCTSSYQPFWFDRQIGQNFYSLMTKHSINFDYLGYTIYHFYQIFLIFNYQKLFKNRLIQMGELELPAASLFNQYFKTADNFTWIKWWVWIKTSIFFFHEFCIKIRSKIRPTYI